MTIAFLLMLGVNRCSAGEHPNVVIGPGFLDPLGQECNAVSLMKRGSNAIIGYRPSKSSMIMQWQKNFQRKVRSLGDPFGSVCRPLRFLNILLDMN